VLFFHPYYTVSTAVILQTKCYKKEIQFLLQISLGMFARRYVKEASAFCSYVHMRWSCKKLFI